MWISVKGYEGIYEVNEEGYVKALKRTWLSGRFRNILKTKEAHIMVPIINKRGYAKVTLLKNGVQKTVPIHQLVAYAFIQNPYNKPQINHINGKRSDNRVCNLEWVTAKENTIHAYLTGLAKGNKRGAHSQARKIKCTTLDMYFDCINDAVETLGVGESVVGKVCSGKQTQTNGLVFRYI